MDTQPQPDLDIDVVERVPGDGRAGRGGSLLVHLRGAVTVATARGLAERLADLFVDGTRVIVDLTGVTEADLAALFTLADECAVARARGCAVVLAAPAPVVRNLLAGAGAGPDADPDPRVETGRWTAPVDGRRGRQNLRGAGRRAQRCRRGGEAR